MLQTALRRAIILLLLATSTYSEDSAAAAANDGGNSQYTVCSGSTIQVTGLTTSCSSRGAYYYGSSKYRNSGSCQSGDKLVLQVSLYISKDLDQDAYLDVMVKTPYTTMEVIKAASLCDTIKATDKTTCPAQGYYEYSTTVYLDETEDGSSNESFVPTAVIGTYSGKVQGQYDLGGANTNSCSGSTSVSWSGVKGAGNSVGRFLMTFGILFAAVAGVVGVGYFIAKQANNNDAMSRNNPLIQDTSDPDEDYQKVSMMGSNRMLVDF